MSDRIPLDHLTSDALDALYAEIDRLTAELGDYETRVGQLEDLLSVAHGTSNRSETERARAEAALVRVQHVADLIEAGAPWTASHQTTAARIREAAADRPPAGGHVYLSTGCRHGQHGYCQAHTGQSGQKRPASCKFCGAPCICGCHQDAATGPLVDRPFRTHRQPTTAATEATNEARCCGKPGGAVCVHDLNPPTEA